MSLSKKGLPGQSEPPMIQPGATLGIIGGGQLGQMIGSAAVSMGFKVIVLDPTPECPASRVAEQIVAEYDDPDAVFKLAERSDVITYEFENISAQTLGAVTCVSHVPQGTEALEICQDRRAEKRFLDEIGIPIAPYTVVNSAETLNRGVEKIGFPSVLKTTRGGYDGKGQVVLRCDDDLVAARALADLSECVLEAWIDFTEEVSVIVAGNPQGEYVCFPVGENIHVNNILHQTIVPARVSEQLQFEAQQLALRIAKEVHLVGVMGIEMFVGQAGNVVVNELAPRPHNSGHYTIEACSFSQFEGHVRGVCGWPLTKPVLLSPVVMTNILGQHQSAAIEAISTEPGWGFHFYGKSEAKRGRKMGHVTCLTEDTAAVVKEVAASRIWD